MGRGFDIPWEGGSKYHGWGVRYTMGKGVEIPYIGGGENTMVNGSIYYG
jgi:hypothetical protein